MNHSVVKMEHSLYLKMMNHSVVKMEHSLVVKRIGRGLSIDRHSLVVKKIGTGLSTDLHKMADSLVVNSMVNSMLCLQGITLGDGLVYYLERCLGKMEVMADQVDGLDHSLVV